MLRANPVTLKPHVVLSKCEVGGSAVLCEGEVGGSVVLSQAGMRFAYSEVSAHRATIQSNSSIRSLRNKYKCYNLASGEDTFLTLMCRGS